MRPSSSTPSKRDRDLESLSKKMRTLIFAPDPGGHRLHHVGLIAEALLGLGHQVDVALPERALESAEFATHLGAIEPSLVEVTPINSSVQNPWAIAGQNLRSLKAILRRLEPDHTYIPYADGMTQRGALEATMRWRQLPRTSYLEALHLGGHFAYVTRNLRSEILRRSSRAAIVRAPWDYLHLLDPFAFEDLSNRLARFSRDLNLDLMPEPVESGLDGSAADARALLGLDQDARYVGCVGAIDTRKGIDRLLDAFSKGVAKESKLLLVGKHDSTIRAALRDDFSAQVRAGSIVSIDAYVSQQELQAAISASDVVALPYRKHSGSSGIAVRAAAAGKPIVASDYGWLGECVRRFDLGVTCDAGRPDELASAIASMLRRAPTFALSQRGRRFVEFNTEDSFAAVWTRQIQIRSGTVPETDAKTWNWVMTGTEDSTGA